MNSGVIPRRWLAATVLLSAFRLCGNWKQGCEKISNIFNQVVIYVKMYKYAKKNKKFLKKIIIKKSIQVPELHSSNEYSANILGLIIHTPLAWSWWPFNLCTISMTRIVTQMIWPLSTMSFAYSAEICFRVMDSEDVAWT